MKAPVELCQLLCSLGYETLDIGDAVLEMNTGKFYRIITLSETLSKRVEFQEFNFDWPTVEQAVKEMICN